MKNQIFLLSMMAFLSGCTGVSFSAPNSAQSNSVQSTAQPPAFKSPSTPPPTTPPPSPPPPAPPPPSSPPPVNNCPNGLSAATSALATAIQAMAAPGDQSTSATIQSAGTINCFVGLDSFSARAVDAYGFTITAVQVSETDYIHQESESQAPGLATIGLGCDFHYTASNVDNMYQLDLNWFVMYGLKGNGSEQVYICVAGTDPYTCDPTSSSFIGGFVWGSGSQTNYDDQAAGANASLTAVSVGFTSNSATDALDSDVISEILVNGGQTFSGTTLNQCDAVGVYSPLVIEKVSGSGIKTSNPYSTKTYFDLTGSGTKERISCVTDAAFLTLPDAEGQIININQLFGNNTVGPDGRKAATGFLALGKYDHKSTSNGYGKITEADPIFSQLRLWEDTNCDGVAQPSELHPLSDWNITSIQWNSAIPMKESDAYGNETEERSWTFQGQNKMRRIFDLWFAADYGSER